MYWMSLGVFNLEFSLFGDFGGLETAKSRKLMHVFEKLEFPSRELAQLTQYKKGVRRELHTFFS